MSTQFIERLAVEIDGEGEPLVCIHGLGGSSNNWTPIEAALRNFRVIRIDLPGSARSAGVGGALTIERMADSVVAVCDKLGVSRAHFMGHSLGTIVCFQIATTQAHRVKSLALFGPLLCPPDAARPNIRARAGKARNEGMAGMQEIADAIVGGAVSVTSRREQPAVAALVRESIMRQDADGYARSCEALANAQAAAVEAISCPTLLVTGDEDGVAPAQSVRAIGDRIPGSRVIVFPQCGHWTTYERAHDCMRELKDFYSVRFQ